MADAAPSPTVPVLLTLKEVAGILHMTVRQVRRLGREPAGLPIVYVTRKKRFVRPEDLDAFLARRVAGPRYTVYHPPHDGEGRAAGANAARPDAGAAGQAPRRHAGDRDAVGDG